ncbi:MAG TPA: hypothetical protein VMG10_21815 [Gemmataceae bacterium]|nr:hypothetical protein [Gemmataceae bacterium]
MSISDQEAALARLRTQRQQLQQALLQVERQIIRARLQVVTVEERIVRLSRGQRPAA